MQHILFAAKFCIATKICIAAEICIVEICIAIEICSRFCIAEICIVEICIVAEICSRNLQPFRFFCMLNVFLDNKLLGFLIFCVFD